VTTTELDAYKVRLKKLDAVAIAGEITITTRELKAAKGPDKGIWLAKLNAAHAEASERRSVSTFVGGAGRLPAATATTRTVVRPL
jgi:hypothetical protein